MLAEDEEWSNYDKPRQCVEKQRHRFADKVHLIQAMVFPVVMHGCERDHKEVRAPKNWCLQTVVLEKTLGSPLDSRAAHWKRPWGGERLKAEEGGRGWDGWMHHRFSGRELGQTPADGEGQRGLACCSPWGHKELNTTWRRNNNNNEELGGHGEGWTGGSLDPYHYRDYPLDYCRGKDKSYFNKLLRCQSCSLALFVFR